MSKRLRLFVVAIAALALVLGAIVFTGVSTQREKQELEARLEALQRAASAGAAGRSTCEGLTAKVEQDLPALEASEGASERVKKGYRALGDCQTQLGRHQQAVDAYSKVVFFEPEQARAHGDLARAYSRAGKSNEALRHGHLAVQLAPNSWQAHRVLARVLESNNQYPAALDSMRKAAQLAPANEQSGAQKAVVRLEAKIGGMTTAEASAGGDDE